VGGDDTFPVEGQRSDDLKLGNKCKRMGRERKIARWRTSSKEIRRYWTGGGAGDKSDLPFSTT
jgi:hypothetical protein